MSINVSILVCFLYVFIGAAVSFVMYRLQMRGRRVDEFGCVLTGLFWPIMAPFAFALLFAKYGFPWEKQKND